MTKPSKNTLLRQVSVLRLTNNGYSAQLMEAERLKGDRLHALPPGRPISAIPIHCLPGAPEGWIRDPGSYVVKVNKECGLWFDWRGNDEFNTAVVPTVKGMNPITGMQTENVFMQQYREKCPKHDIPFAHGLYCEKCGYKWPAQNYVSNPNILWWDGFRQADGSVRQFFFTEEDMKDVASAIIGKENTVPAFGFAFYRCTNDRRPAERPRSVSNDSFGFTSGVLLDNQSFDICDYVPSEITYGPSYSESSGSSRSSSSSSSASSQPSESSKPYYEPYKPLTKMKKKQSYTKGFKSGGTKGLTRSITASACMPTASSAPGVASEQVCYSADSIDIISRDCFPVEESRVSDESLVTHALDAGEAAAFSKEPEAVQERFVKDVSVGAGARIRQNLELDKTPLNEWGEKPESLITLYFVFEEQLEAIIEKGGIRELENQPQGYLENVPVG